MMFSMNCMNVTSACWIFLGF